MEQEVANNIYELSSDFALRIVNLYKYLTDEKKEFVDSKGYQTSSLKAQLITYN